MTRNAPRILMTFILLSSGILSFLLDWSPNHLLNPLWHPHARFHGALLLFFLAGVALTGTWLLWRRSTEPEVAFTVAARLTAPPLHPSWRGPALGRARPAPSAPRRLPGRKSPPSPSPGPKSSFASH